MPSSTSSFEALNPDTRVPDGPWGRTWVVAVLLCLGIAGAFEAFARQQGHHPSVEDDSQLWIHWRKRVYEGRERSVVLLGGSRMGLGVSLKEFQKAHPDFPVTQLAVSGTQPVAALRDLAADERFGGVVVIDVTEASLERKRWPSQEYLVKAYRADQPLDFELNLSASLVVQEHFAVINPFLNLSKLAVTAISTRKFRAAYHVTGFRDRSQEADFQKIDDMPAFVKSQQARVRTLAEPPSSPDEWLAAVSEVSGFADRIQSRGGQVVFLYMPQGAVQWEVTDRLYPRAEYWERFAKTTKASTIYARDFSELNDFVVPDEAHLDVRDVPRFTQALLRRLERLGVLPASPH